MKIWKKAMLFSVGGGLYFCLELLWRGKSHPSMFALGGICFLVIGKVADRCSHLACPLRAGLGALAVSALELGAGLLVNRQYRVWDYRGLPLNFMGQICLLYSLLWIPVVWVAMGLYRGIRQALSRLP